MRGECTAPDHGIHAQAAVGFDRAGADYERGRPGYPEDALETMARELGIESGRVVVDLAAGTGKLTRALTRFGARLIAVEPVRGMREQLVAVLPGVEALDGTAEQIPLGDASADAVVVAQAFHWFDASRAATEIHRVLRPGGGLGVIWNAWDEAVPWVAQVQAIVHEHAGDAPRQATSSWEQKLAETGLFTPLSRRGYPNPVVGDLATLLARVASTSYIAALEPSDRQAVLRRVRAVIASDPQSRGRDELVTPYGTHLVWCHTSA